MILTPSFDQEFCEALGLNTDTGHLIDLIYKLPTWSQSRETTDGLYYFLDYGKIIKELPSVFKSKAKITRLLTPLIELEIIECITVKRSYYLRTSKDLKMFWKKVKIGNSKQAKSDCFKNETYKKWQSFVSKMKDSVSKMKRDVSKMKPIRTPAISTPIIRTLIKSEIACSKNETIKSNSKEPKSKAVWIAYALAYKNRYGHEPIRSAKVNKQLCLLVDETGQDAPLIAEYYLLLNNNWYQQKGHDVATLLQNAQAIRTQWLNNTNRTSIDVRNTERQSTTLSAVDAVKAKIARGEI
jgi:hypothetical protein